MVNHSGHFHPLGSAFERRAGENIPVKAAAGFDVGDRYIM